MNRFDGANVFASTINSVEEVNRLVWGGRIAMATTAHLIGGLGLGLLSYRSFGSGRQFWGYTMLALSLGMHAYAFLTALSGRTRIRERAAA